MSNRNEILNRNKWDRRSSTYDEKRFDYFRFMQRRLVTLLNMKKGTKILDLGCGTGWAVRYASRLLQEQGEFHGIDISLKMIERAKNNSITYGNVHFTVASTGKLPFKEDYFDYIICSNSFHHYLHPDAVLKEVYRTLCSDGSVMILDTTADGFLVKKLDAWLRIKEPEHVRFYSTQQYRQLFKAAQLSYIQSKTIIYPMMVHVGCKK